MARCDRLFYYPTKIRYASPHDYGLTYHDVYFCSRDGTKLHGWFFPAAGRRSTGGTVVHCHGNAGNITGHFEFVRWLPGRGWNCFCFDYRGFGESAGRPSREGIVLDTHAAVDYVSRLPGVDPGSIVLFGQSIGGAAAIVVAAQRRDLAGVAVDGPVSDYRRIAAWHIRHNPLLFALAWWLPRTLIPRGLDPIDYVGQVSPVPLFIFTGDADRVVDYRMSCELYEAAREPKKLWIIPGLDHMEALQKLADETQRRLLNFFQQCVERQQSACQQPSR